MNYIPFGMKLPSWKDTKTPRAIKIRKKQICNHCTKDIEKGEIAVICWTIEIYHNPNSNGGKYHNKPTILYKTYLHEKCADIYEEEIEARLN